MSPIRPPGPRPLTTARVPDQQLDQHLREHREAIETLQRVPQLKVIKNVTLEDGKVTPVPHGLGRAPQAFWTTPPKFGTATGRIVTGTGSDLNTYVILAAHGWGATIVVDVIVVPS